MTRVLKHLRFRPLVVIAAVAALGSPSVSSGQQAAPAVAPVALGGASRFPGRPLLRLGAAAAAAHRRAAPPEMVQLRGGE